MIFLVIVRRCECVVCNGTFDLEGEEKPPDRCKHCNSPNWEFGSETRESIFLRTGKKKVARSFNPGAKSRNRQERGKAQWRRFKPKPLDSPQDQP